MNNMYDPDRLAVRSAGQTKAVSRIFNFVYGWMAVGLAVSGIVAWVMGMQLAEGKMALPPSAFMVAMVVEIGLVFWLSLGIKKMSAAMATGLFMLYAAVNGVTLSLLFVIYDLGTLQTVFFITAATFGGLALFGTLTRMDLSGVGSICGMALWGIIIASIVNIFMRSTGFQTLISYVGVLVFVGLTAWDAQKIKRLASMESQLDDVTIRKLGIISALQLYLDFINLFLYLLQLFGGKGRK